MKGQFVFEFLIAGLIFFVIVVYSINYLNVSVSDFKTTGRNFYLWCFSLSKDGEVRFKDLVLRHLPKDRKLDAPTELPKVPDKP